MLAEVLECCSIKVSTGNETRRYIDCFKTKTIKEKQADGSVVTKKNFFKRKFEDGREIKKEILLLALCPNCKHYILKYLWYAKASDRFYDWAESKVIKGKKADEIFNRRADDYEFYDIPDPEANKPKIKHSKKVPWVYGKILNDNTQVPRYIDETDNAGRKVYNPAKTEKILADPPLNFPLTNKEKEKQYFQILL